MRRKAGLVAIAMCAISLAVAACGGDGGATVRGEPTLRSSPIPTVPLPTATPVDCSLPEGLEMPADFPDEIPVPPEFIATEIEREPNLRVTGLAMPPLTGREPEHGVVIAGVLDGLQIRRGWTAAFNQRIEGLDYTVTAPDDGRQLHVNASRRVGCPGHVVLLYDVLWLTQGE